MEFSTLFGVDGKHIEIIKPQNLARIFLITNIHLLF